MKALKLCFIALGTLIPTILFAQNGKITGYVRDVNTQEPIIGVVISTENGSFGGVTDIDGYYRITEIPVGGYNLTATYFGYKPAGKYDIQVTSGNTLNLNFELTETSDSLNEVVVQANPFETTVETPNSVNKLSQVEIAKYPGGNNDIAKVVQSLPGVSGSVGFRNDIIIRGGAPNENVYYLDEIEIPNINHFATQGAAGGPVGILNVSFIEDVTLYGSAFPAQYDNPLSGAIYFKQRNGNPEEFQGNLRISATEAALTVEGPFSKKNKKTTFIAGVRRSYLDFLFEYLIDLPFVPQYWDYQLKVNHSIDKKNSISLIGLGSIDDLSLNPPEAPEDPTNEEEQAEYLEKLAVLELIYLIRQTTNTTGVSWKRLIPEGYFTLALSNNTLQNTLTKREDPLNAESPVNQEFNFTENETKLRFNYNKFLGDYALGAGGTVQNAYYRNTSYQLIERERIDSQGNSQITREETDFLTDLNFQRFGVFSTISRSFLGERLSLSAGFRLDGNNYNTYMQNPFNQFAPRFNALFYISDKWTASFTTGRYYKLPPYTILGYRDEENELANQDAKYIRSDHIVGGIAFLPTNSTKISLESFYKRYNNYPVSIANGISLANEGGDFGFTGNEAVDFDGKGRAYGLEFLFQQKLTKNFYGIFAYTLYWSEFTGEDGEFISTAWDNRHLISFTGGYKFPRNWELGVRWRFLGPRPYTPIDEDATLEQYASTGFVVLDYERTNQERTRAFNAADIRITKQWNFNKYSLQAFLELQNAYAAQEPSIPSYTLARDAENEYIRPFQLVNVDLGDNSVLPTIGIVLEF